MVPRKLYFSTLSKEFLKASKNYCSGIYPVYTIALKHFLPQCVIYVSEEDRKRKQVMANHTCPISLPGCIFKFLEHKNIYSTNVSSSVPQKFMLNKYGLCELMAQGNLTSNFTKLVIASLFLQANVQSVQPSRPSKIFSHHLTVVITSLFPSFENIHWPIGNVKLFVSTYPILILFCIA